jgi:type IV secretion system protein TrbL
MNDLGVIDQFLQTFSTYIDSGFGLLGPDVAYLTTTLVAIDITLAGLFWALSEHTHVIPQLIKKVLYVGAFALILNNFAGLATIIFDSFAALGLKASGSALTAADLMRPGFVAATGYTAATPLLQEAGKLMGPVAFFENFVTIAVLMFAWITVLLAFFILAVQLFVTILEFKLTTLAGFVLVPFALWNKTSFLAERVLGNVIAAGVKLMVLAIIVGIGSSLFATITSSFNGDEITLQQAVSTVLAAIAIFGLGIFGPGIAAGLLSGAPQLGAGAAIGTVAGLGAGAIAGTGLAIGGLRGVGSAAAGTLRAGAALTGGARTAFDLGRVASGEAGAAGVAAGAAGVARAGFDAAAGVAAKPFEAMRQAYSQGAREAFVVTGGTDPGMSTEAARVDSNAPPSWARRLRAEQQIRDTAGVATHLAREGDHPVGGDAPRLREEENA